MCHKYFNFIFIFSVSNTAYLAVVYEYASEMTYPLPEVTSGGLVNLGSRVSSLHMVGEICAYGGVDSLSLSLSLSLPPSLSIYLSFSLTYTQTHSRTHTHTHTHTPFSLIIATQPFSILMVVVGPMFMTLNGKEMPIGGWIIVLLTLFAAVLACMY